MILDEQQRGQGSDKMDFMKIGVLTSFEVCHSQGVEWTLMGPRLQKEAMSATLVT